MREGRGFIDPGTGVSRAALANPLYELKEPVYLQATPEAEEVSDSMDASAARADGDNGGEPGARDGRSIRFTLHIDTDGPDALGVVSGTVARGEIISGKTAPHFIGRVMEDAPSGDTRTLAVEGFGFLWPRSVSRIDRVEIRLAGSILVKPTAEVTFVDTSRRRRYGPFGAAQASTHFREVEVEVDREKNSIDVEPCSSHAHPDRPGDVSREDMTLESVFGRAGIRITRSPGSGTVVESGEAGTDRKWSYVELHDSMQLHWDAFANRPQWKMWIFLANRANDDSLGGVMFDGDIDEPGGVDRQGTALFTGCPFFHTEAGGYPAANPPARDAVRRELFFNLIHETGHAFNLAHSFQKQLEIGPGEGGAWTPPRWMPLRDNKQALSWMNYPDAATPGAGAGANATWFYQRFRFRFDDNELLFLRHAPESYVQMGNAAWFRNHGRVARESVDPRLELVVRGLKATVELGESVFIELRIGLRAGVTQPVAAHWNLSPSDGFVELAVTNPRGERRPFIPIAHTRRSVHPHVLEPGKERLYYSVNMTAGQFGFPFKEPGPYRIEAAFRNLDGGTAAAVMQLFVRPPVNYDDRRTLGRLLDARVGRTLYVGGTRVLEDVNERLDGVSTRLDDRHPAKYYLAAVRAKPLATPTKVVEPGTLQLRVQDPDPELAARALEPVVEQPEAAADSLGHIRYRSAVDVYTTASTEIGKRTKARDAQRTLLALFEQRDVLPSVRAAVEDRVRELE
ncbi:MAG: hypothetical protein M3373_02610 [Gemmatimonadota bacterium]|nr:hypothetical protein [Gemmatimonadota bacterium]